jgi:hypothetical protein
MILRITKLFCRDTENIVTHVFVGFMKSNKIAYSDRSLLMCGNVKFCTIDKNTIITIIQSSKELYIVSVNERICEE